MTISIDGAAFAAVLDALPARLRKRLDASVERAADWAREESADGANLLIRVDEETAVTVRVTAGVVVSAEDVSCVCLLAPACLHRAAVASILPLHDASDVPAAESLAESVTTDARGGAQSANTEKTDAAPSESASTATSAPPAGASQTLSVRERAAASALWDSAVAVLTAGLVGASRFTEAELARATHQARAIGLHRASAAGVRVAAGLRSARERSGEHRLGRFTADLRELMLVTHQLTHLHEGAEQTDELRGMARRSYQEHGSLRLYGLFTEPVVAGSGYAGVVSYAVDVDGVVWSTATIAPGGRSLVRPSYISSLKLGGTTLTHREFGRAGVMVSAATSSADRRLGGGTSTKAVRTAGVEWSRAPVAGLFDQPLSAQFARALAVDPEDGSFRAGDDLVFLRGRVLGVGAPGLVLGLIEPDDDVPEGGDTLEAREARMLWCVLPEGSAVYQRNFERLAEVGPELRVIARPDRAQPGTVHALAVAVEAEDAAALALPEEWQGRVNLGIDRIPLPDEDTQDAQDAQDARSSEATESTATAEPVEGAESQETTPVEDPSAAANISARMPTAESTSLHLLRHHIEHAASAGRAITRTALLERDCTRLDAEAMHVAASLLRELVVQAAPARDQFARPIDTEERPKNGYARTWLAAAVYEHAAATELAVRQWSRAMR
ncbi:hypothetical protein KDL01_26705 [Actinospica durhamensis]|uniref:SWIM-type domain-containing protein n=1 Tax=Actinospica durhamensis TaxID=1508375 RepID=A0A941ERW1_9ACTN|nr:hypothetical protein [Actinospica durhamensis]MBR7836897.1 hypothetical protein [Actinospica durhamensis]